MDSPTDIVVTIGPASESSAILEKLILAGANVFRFSFARDSSAQNAERTWRLQQLAERLDRRIFTMQDVPGPKLRLANKDIVAVSCGEKLRIGFGESQTPYKALPLPFPVSFDGIPEGCVVYFGDGEVEARLDSQMDNNNVLCEVVNDGVIEEGRGVTFQHFNTGVQGGCLTERDELLLREAAHLHYDYVALSFVRSKNDIIRAREFLATLEGNCPRVIAKIETAEGIDNITSILEASDGLMVARGDMGIQIPYECIPDAQRKLLKASRAVGKYSIVATQMLESASSRRVPNRAEIIDVANAVYQGASAVMLSGETRTGPSPIYTVEVLERIVRQAERDMRE